MVQFSYRSLFQPQHLSLLKKINPFNQDEEPVLKGLRGLYLNASLRTFGLSLISIFIPLYILDITGEVSWVFTFYLLYFSVMLIVDYPLAWLVTKLKPDFAALISNILLMAFLIIMQLAENNPSLLIYAALISSFRTPLYWLPYHLSFINLGERRKFGGEVSATKILGRVASALAPLIGSLLIKVGGFDLVFQVALLIIFFSVIPLFFDSYNKKEELSPLPKIIGDMFEKEKIDDTIGFLGEGTEPFIATVFWPLFLYLEVQSYQLVGVITSISLVLSLITLAVMKRYVDQREKKFFKVGMIGNIANWIMRIFATTTPHFFMANISHNLLSLFVWMPFNSVFCKKAKEKKVFDYIERRELLIHFSRLMVTVLVALIWKYTRSFYLIFLVAALGLFMSQTMLRKK
jgi:hypothetical protein